VREAGRKYVCRPGADVARPAARVWVCVCVGAAGRARARVWVGHGREGGMSPCITVCGFALGVPPPHPPPYTHTSHRTHVSAVRGLQHAPALVPVATVRAVRAVAEAVAGLGSRQGVQDGVQLVEREVVGRGGLNRLRLGLG
jgi:hypothetical protein